LIQWFLGVLVALLGTAAQAQTPNVFRTDVQMCSGRPWIDVTCNGADPTGVADSTSAINTTFNTAITNGWPVLFPAGTYKVTSKITIDYQGQAANGLEILSRGATLDGRTIGAGNVLQFQCSGGTTAAPLICNNLRISGSLTVVGNGAGYVVIIGKTDLSDQHKGARVEHLVVTNAGAGGAIQANYLTDGDLWFSGTTSGGSASVGAVTLEQVQSSKIGGWGSAGGASAPGLLLENGSSSSNQFLGFAYDPNTNTCVSITSATAVRNAWLAPSFPCTTAVNASGNATRNMLVGAAFTGANRGPISQGIELIGRGSLHRYMAPTAASYTAAGTDDGTIVSAANGTGGAINWGGNTASGASITVTLPDPASVGQGWTMGFANDNSKAVVVNVSAGKILAGGLQLSTMTLGPGNFEFVQITSDGANYRIAGSSAGTGEMNGIQTSHFPARWVFLPGPSYAATEADNGSVLSSALVGGSLIVQMPVASTLIKGWTVGVSANTANPVTVNVAPGDGNRMVMGDGSVVGSYLFNANAVEVFHFDGSQFRHVTSAGEVIAQKGIYNDNKTGGITASGSTVAVSSDGTLIDSLIGANVAFNSLAGVINTHPGNTLINNIAVAGYALNNNPSDGTRGNTVAGYFSGTAAVAGTWTWGSNPIVQDRVGLAAGTHLTGEEVDVSTLNAADVAIGVQISGAATVTPVSAVAVVVTPLGSFANPPIPWGAGFFTQPGATTIGVELGPLAAAGVNVNSQPMYYNVFDASGVTQSYIVQAAPGSLNFYSSISNPSFQFNGELGLTPGKFFILDGFDALGTISTSQLILGADVNWTNIIIGNGTAPLTLNGDGLLPGTKLVSQLPGCVSGKLGWVFVVVDGNSIAYNAPVSGGGAQITPVVCDGSTWRAH
jgi:hypothetical protein